jgi:hypothetical protein
MQNKKTHVYLNIIVGNSGGSVPSFNPIPHLGHPNISLSLIASNIKGIRKKVPHLWHCISKTILSLPLPYITYCSYYKNFSELFRRNIL